MGQGGEHRPVRTTKGTPALCGAETARRNDRPRPARSDAAIPVRAARGIAGGKTGRPGPLPGADAGAAGDLRSSFPPLAHGAVQCDIGTGTVMLRSTMLTGLPVQSSTTRTPVAPLSRRFK